MTKQDNNDIVDNSIYALNSQLDMANSANLSLNYIDESKIFKESDSVLTSRIPQKMKETKKIAVCIRKKPSSKEQDIITINKDMIIVKSNKLAVDLTKSLLYYKFSFDTVYDEQITNSQIFNSNIRPLITHALEGGSSSIIAYGQTNSGKTYTLLEPYTGILFESMEYIISSGAKGTISFCEIYMGRIYDCFNNNNRLSLFEKNGDIYFSEITEMSFASFDEIKDIFKDGLANRTSGSTDSNKYSSRSHAVIIVEFNILDQRSRILNYKKIASDNSLIFVDLAGSEKGSDRKTCSRETMNEGSEINKSLLALKECIRGLEFNDKYKPFRSSRLTQILKNSFMKNSKTCMIATISSEPNNVEQTLNTLRYMRRIKEAKIELGNIKQMFSSASYIEELEDFSIDDCRTLSITNDETFQSKTRLFSQSEKDNKVRQIKPMSLFDSNLECLLEGQNVANSSFSNATGISDNTSSVKLDQNYSVHRESFCSDLDNKESRKRSYLKITAESITEANDKVSPKNPFLSAIENNSSILSPSIVFQKSKISNLLNEITYLINEETNFDKLKGNFVKLGEIRDGLKKL